MGVQIDGWELYPNESREAIKEAIKKKSKIELLKAGITGKIDVEITFTPVPDDCDKLRWFARMLSKALKKAGAEEAAKHFEHWISGKGNAGAPSLTEEIIKSTSCYKKLIAKLKEKCCGNDGRTPSEGKEECSEYGSNWRLHVLLGGYLIYYKMGARGADGCCAVTISIDDPYDFHFGKSATFQDKKKTKVTLEGNEIEITVNFTFRVPDEVLTKLKKCKNSDKADGKFPADFDRKLTFTDKVCCEKEKGPKKLEEKKPTDSPKNKSEKEDPR